MRIVDNIAPFLRRPFSIAGAFPDSGRVDIIYRIVGKGTELLSRLGKGEYLDCLGPLGTPFSPARDIAVSVLLAGGVGIAPLLFLARILSGEGKKILVYYGASTSGELLPLKEFFTEKAEVLATEDGSAGYQGPVTDLFESTLVAGTKADLCCGPKPMLKILAQK